MVDEKPRSILAEKALAQKAKRDAEVHSASDARQAQAEQAESARTLWVQFSHNLPEVVRAINDELADTGTSLSLQWNDPPTLQQQLGTATITVKRDGMSLNFQKLSFSVFKSGAGVMLDAISRMDKKKHDFLIGDADREWLQRMVHDFVSRALD